MRRLPKRGAAVAAACLALAAVAAVRLGQHHGTGAAGHGGTPPPQPQQAYAVARQEFGLLAGGGWAQAWSLWTDGARQAVPQAEFVRVNTACRPVAGVPYVIDGSTAVSATAVRVDWHRAGATGSNTLLYQAGHWRFAPDAATLADYGLGTDQLIATRRAAHSCH